MKLKNVGLIVFIAGMTVCISATIYSRKNKSSMLNSPLPTQVRKEDRLPSLASIDVESLRQVLQINLAGTKGMQLLILYDSTDCFIFAHFRGINDNAEASFFGPEWSECHEAAKVILIEMNLPDDVKQKATWWNLRESDLFLFSEKLGSQGSRGYAALRKLDGFVDIFVVLPIPTATMPRGLIAKMSTLDLRASPFSPYSPTVCLEAAWP